MTSIILKTAITIITGALIFLTLSAVAYGQFGYAIIIGLLAYGSYREARTIFGPSL